jgi:hypothetical protein
MITRISAFVTVFLVAIAAILGLFYRPSYTDVSQEEDYLDSLSVAELPENLAKKACTSLSEELESSPIVLRVTATDSLECLYHVSRQKVRVEQIFAGENISVGTEIYLTSSRWSMIYDADYAVMERGFVNVMKEGKEYLVFLSEQIEGLNEKTPVYRINTETFVVPIFCYEDGERVVIEPEGDNTYVPYSQVKENEFFGLSEAAFDSWAKLKQEMLEKYPYPC